MQTFKKFIGCLMTLAIVATHLSVAQAAPTNFTYVDSRELFRGLGPFRAALVDRLRGFAYFVSREIPGRIVRIRLSDWSHVDHLMLGETEHVGAGVIDAANGYAYLGLTGRIVRIGLSGFARDGHLDIAGYRNTNTACVDTLHGFAYFVDDLSNVVKVRLSDFTVQEQIRLTGDTSLRTSAIDSANQIAYLSSPNRIVKVRLNPLARDTALDMPAGVRLADVATLNTTSQRLYLATILPLPIRIREFDVSSLQETRNAPVSGVQVVASLLYDSARDAILCLADGTESRLLKVRPSDFAIVDERVDTSARLIEARASALNEVDGTAYYASSDGAVQHISEVSVSDLSISRSRPYEGGENQPQAALFDVVRGYGYVIPSMEVTRSAASAVRIVRFRLADFRRDGEFEIPGAIESRSTAAIDHENGRLYVICRRFDVAERVLHKMRLCDGTIETRRALPLIGEPAPVAVDPVSGFAFVANGAPSAPVRFLKIRLSDLAIVGTLVFAGNPSAACTKILVDPSSSYVYFCMGNPALGSPLVRVPLDTFDRHEALPMASGNTLIHTAELDADRRFIYAISNTPGMPLHRIRLSDFSIDASNPLFPSSGPLARSLLIDSANQFGYVGLANAPGTVLKVNLQTLTNMASMSTPEYENNFSAGFLDPVNLMAYFATETMPGRLVRLDVRNNPPTPFTFVTSSLQEGVAGRAYNQPLLASGGTRPIGWTTISGTLPAGLTLLPEGAIAGTPSGPDGSVNLTFQARDNNSQTVQRTLSLRIYAAAPTLSIQTATLPPGTQGRPYSQSLVAEGVGPYVWRLESGALPPGVSLNEAGLISGIPAEIGPSNFVVSVRDNSCPSQTATRSLSIQIDAPPVPPPLVDAISPDRGPTNGGTAVTITGQHFASNTTVRFGASAPIVAEFISATELRVTTPPGDPRTVDVIVRNPDDDLSFVLRNGFTYLSPPFISRIAPNSGPVAGGTRVRIDGGNFGTVLDQVKVIFDTDALTPITVQNNFVEVITVGHPAGSVDVTVRRDTFADAVQTNGYRFVDSVLSIGTTQLPNGQVGVPYDQTLRATGGTPPYSWTHTGNLPLGLALSAAGVLSGIPTLANPYTFTVRVNDQTIPPRTAQRTFTITIAPLPADPPKDPPGEDPPGEDPPGGQPPPGQEPPASAPSVRKPRPNPLQLWKGQKSVRFADLVAGTDIKIFSMSGRLIREARADDNGEFVWLAEDDRGDVVASGVYLVKAKTVAGEKTFFIAVEK